MIVNRIAHSDPHCRVCNSSTGFLRTAAPTPAPFKNPYYTGSPGKDSQSQGGQFGHHWYHGTTQPSFQDENDEVGNYDPEKHDRLRGPQERGVESGPGNGRNGAHWNTDLGVHFSGLHSVAKNSFTDVRRGESAAGSRVAHASLHMANPKHYRDEAHMDTDAIRWAKNNGHHFLPQGDDQHDTDSIHDDFEEGRYNEVNYHHNSKHDYDHMDWHGNADGSTPSSIVEAEKATPKNTHEVSDQGKEQWLRHHPERTDIVNGFRQHLMDKGHDGITYGNSYEGPLHHTSAIAFPSTPITIHRWEAAGKPNPPKPSDREDLRQMKLFSAAQFAGPHHMALKLAQDITRDAHPELQERVPAPRSAPLRNLLSAHDHPKAQDAFVMVHGDQSKGQSETVFDQHGNPGVALHDARNDMGTLAHEAAHHLHLNASGESHEGKTDDFIHGPDFVDHYRSALNHVAPGAGDTLHKNYHQMLPSKLQMAKGPMGKSLFRQSSAHGKTAVIDPETGLPIDRVFGRTYGLDHRLWDGDHLRFEIRKAIVEKFDRFCTQHGYKAWRTWAKIVFFGSEASEWTSATLEGNSDFDLSIGIEYQKLRKSNSEFKGLLDDEIAPRFTDEMHAELNDPNTYFTTSEGTTGPYDQTWFQNQLGWNIETMKPYSAYDVVRGEWIVKPPHLPDWNINAFPQGPGLIDEIKGVLQMAKGILSMPEPYKTQQGSALWHYVHDNRAGAFGEDGEGWWDDRNVVEKALDQAELMQPLWECMQRAKEHPDSVHAPKGWSNDPSTVSV